MPHQARRGLFWLLLCPDLQILNAGPNSAFCECKLSPRCIKPFIHLLGGNEIRSLHTKWMKVIREANEHLSIFNATLIKYFFFFFFLLHNFLTVKHSLIKIPWGRLHALLSSLKQRFPYCNMNVVEDQEVSLMLLVFRHKTRSEHWIPLAPTLVCFATNGLWWLSFYCYKNCTIWHFEKKFA